MDDMTLKSSQYLSLLMEKPLGHDFQIWSPYYQVAQCNQNIPIPVSSSDRSGLRKPASTDLTIKPDLDLTNPIGKHSL